jgi:hypothetical protein
MSIVCIYAYHETELSKKNLNYFLVHGILQNVEYFFVINDETVVDDDFVILETENVTIIRRKNKGFDFGAYSHVVKKRLKKTYDYYVFMNGTVEGPSVKNWTQPFIDLFKDDTHLVGATINMYPYSTFAGLRLGILYGNKQMYSHVQSMFFMLDKIGFDYLLGISFFDDEEELNRLPNTIAGKNLVIFKKEFGLSQHLLNNNWNISAYLQEFRDIDYRTVESPIFCNNGETDVNWDSAYHGRSLRPEDVIFLKNNRYS